jgi:hypothetical protein
MLNMECETKLSPEEVVGRLKAFFGKSGLGLSLQEESPQCLSFQGGGGYVSATVCPEGKKTRIDLVTQEWDHHVRRFCEDLP